MFRTMLKNILNHPALHEAVNRFKKIEESQSEILLKLSEIKAYLGCEDFQDVSDESALHRNGALEMLTLDIADLSKRVYFIELELEKNANRKPVIFRRLYLWFSQYQMLLAAMSLAVVTFFGIYTLFILNS
jgi:hypothetical protein